MMPFPSWRERLFISYQSYSRIDFFFIPHSQLHSVIDTTIGSVTWSDHVPIFLKYIFDPSHRNQITLKLNESPLQDQEVLEDVRREVTWFFQTNDILDCNPRVIWEAHKAVTWGVLIKHGARIKREREAKLTSILSEIHRLETIYKYTPSSEIERDLLVACRQVTDLLLYKAQKSIPIGRKQFYEFGNKCGGLLFRTLREQQSMTYVPVIMGSEGRKSTLPKQITQKFEELYSSLYNLQQDMPDQLTIDEYLISSGMPGLTNMTQKELDLPITLEELQKAVNSSKPSKSLGSDGFTVYYYKQLMAILGPYLVKMFNGLSDLTSIFYA